MLYMTEMTIHERKHLINLCSLISTYRTDFFESFSDEELRLESQHLLKRQLLKLDENIDRKKGGGWFAVSNDCIS